MESPPAKAEEPMPAAARMRKPPKNNRRLLSLSIELLNRFIFPTRPPPVKPRLRLLREKLPDVPEARHRLGCGGSAFPTEDAAFSPEDSTGFARR